jgi:LPXTG-motif cell wall-anchored protein
MSLRLAAAAALCAAGVAAAASTGAAAHADPPGNNGTIKIDGEPFDTDNNNEPHVVCNFRVKLFDFDLNQRGNIVFTIQPPSGNFNELLRLDDQLLSNDPAGGGQDLDEIFTFSANQLGLGSFTEHPQQGFHVKVTLETSVGPKHKVFWVKPCPPTTPPTSPPTSPPTTAPTSAGAVTTSPAAALPVTGASLGGLVALGIGLVAGGTALMVMRRRRDQATATD